MLKRTLNIYSIHHYVVVDVFFPDTATMVDVFKAEHGIVELVDRYTWMDLRKNPAQVDEAIKEHTGYTAEITASSVRSMDLLDG